jgi:ABC-type hemin transport system substrate-binding protein
MNRRPEYAFGMRARQWWFAAAACVGAAIATTANAATLTDATGRAVAVTDPSRIVSIGGAVTEILYALGMDDKIVAIDTTSLYPTRAAKEKKNVGYMRQLSPEGVLRREGPPGGRGGRGLRPRPMPRQAGRGRPCRVA